MAEQELLSLSEAAKRYGVPITTLRGAIQHGHIEAKKIGHQWVVAPDDIERFLANRPKRGRPPHINPIGNN